MIEKRKGIKRLNKQVIGILLTFAVTFGGTILCAIAFNWLTSKATFTGYISALEWRYDWQVEEWAAIETSCWGAGCIPTSGYSGRYEWQDTGRRRQTGSICNPVKIGKTITTHCTPIYQSIYDDYGIYTLNQWQVTYTVSATGIGTDPSPIYPPIETLDMPRVYGSDTCPENLAVVGEDAPLLGCHRAGQQIPNHWYTVTITSETTLSSNQFQCDVPYDVYMSLRMEQPIRGIYWKALRRFSCSGIELHDQN